MSHEITVVVRGQTGAVKSVPLKGGTAFAAESHNNYRLLVDGSEELPAGTKISRSGRDLKVRFPDGEEVTVSDWAGADGARFQTGGAQVYSDSLRSFVPAQQVESWQFELIGTGDVAAGQLGAAPESLLAASMAPAPATLVSPVAEAAAGATAGAGAGTAAGAAAGAGAGTASSASVGAAGGAATSSTGVSTGTVAAASSGGGFSGSGVLIGLGALGGLAAAAGGGGSSGSSGSGGGGSSSPAPSTPTSVALAAASDSGTAGDSITNDTTPTITGKGDPGATIEVRNSTGTIIATAVVDSASNWTATPANALPDGAVTLQVVSNRGTGTASSSPASLALTIDATPPAAPTVAVPEGPVVNTTENADGIQVNISGTYAAGDSMALVVTRPDASTTTISHAVTAAEVTAGVVAVTVPSQSVQGGYTLRATVTDVAGNSGAASTAVPFTLASTGPAAPVVTLAEAADGYINAVEAASNGGTPVTVALPTGTAAGATVALVLNVPGASPVTFGHLVTAAEATAGTYQEVIPSANLNTNGSYSVTGQVTDASGNLGTASAPNNFIVDRIITAPGAPDLATASDTGVSSTDNLTANTTPTFTGAGAEAGAAVTLYDTNGTSVVGAGTADAGGAWSIVASTLGAGAHTLTAKQIDVAGNASAASSGLVITVDSAGPTFGKALVVNEGFTTLSVDAAALGAADNVSALANLSVSSVSFKSSGSFASADLGISVANGKATITPVAGAADKNGAVVLTVAVQDAAGNTTTQDITFTVNPVNDAPAGADLTVSAPTDGLYTFGTSDFAFTDAADTPSNALKSLLITALPGAGSLQLQGKSVVSGQEITAADLAAGKLTFTPVPGASGANYANFTFQVRDDGGTQFGGVDLDASPNKLTVNVSGLNTAPVLDATKSPAITTAEYAFSGGLDAALHAPAGANPTGVFTAGSLVTGAVMDPDVGAKLGGVGVTSLSATTLGATLWYSTNAGTTWDWITNTAGSQVTKGFYGADGAAGGTDNNVLLLADTARLVFDGGTSGQAASIADGLTIRAWDQSSGANGGSLINPTTGGGAALSKATDTVQVNLGTEAIDLTRLDPTAGVRINGGTAGAQFGWDVSSAGDANGDGYDDLLVSQHGTTGSGGSAYLVYGQSGTYGAIGADATRSVGIGSITGAKFDRPGELMTGVTQLGDFNNDGYADFMISGIQTGSTNTGSSYVVFGGPAIANIGALGVTNAGSKWFQIEAGSTSGIGINNHVASWTGDVNGDGYDDLIIGAQYTPQLGAPPYNFGSGAAYVIYGHAGTQFGAGNDLSLAALRTDVTKLADDGNPAGYLFDAATNTRGIVLGVGASPGYFFGSGAAGLGDRNGDGYADYTVDVDLGGDAGSVNALLLHGKLTTDVAGGGGGNVLWFARENGYTGPDWIGHGAGPGPNVGVNPYRIRIGGTDNYGAKLVEPDRVSSQALGDVNGDGFDDFAMTYNGVGTGEVYVVYGSPTVLDDKSVVQAANGANGFRITGVALGDKLGESIHGIGDFNGDGYDDFIVGAPQNEAGSATNQGGAYIIYGRVDAGADDINLATGVGTRGIAIRGSITGDQAGFAVNSAGDVNGDGLDDVIVGAPLSDAGGADAGAAYLIYGNTNYNNAAAKVGTNLTGTAGPDSLIGTTGNDTLNGGGGADAIFGGLGNDAITVGSNAWQRVDGGSGFDTLKVGAAMTLDFTAVGAGAGQNLSGHTRSIEHIDLVVGSLASKLTISEQDVYQLAGDFNTPSGGSLTGRQSNALFVVGDAADSVTFAEGVAGKNGWTAAATVANPVGDSLTYTQYTHGTASVYVAAGVAVTGVTVGTAVADTLTGTAAGEVIAGGAGADLIFGGAGNDTLYGGALGSTAATSQAGVKDIFGYTLTANVANGDDVIKDFQVGVDKLYVTNTADSYITNSVAVTATPPNGSTAAFAANGTTYQGFNPTAPVTATTNNDIDNNLSIRDLTEATSANQYISFGTDGAGNVKLTMVAGTATSSVILEGVLFEATAVAGNGQYGSLAELMGGGGEQRVLYLTNDPFSGALT